MVSCVIDTQIAITLSILMQLHCNWYQWIAGCFCFMSVGELLGSSVGWLVSWLVGCWVALCVGCWVVQLVGWLNVGFYLC